MKILIIIKTLILSLLSFTSMASQQPNPMNTQDPYEGYNRVMHDFNMGFNDVIGQPVANGYNEYVPDPAKTGISNFFSNLKEPINMINNFLQGKGEAGLTSFMRFTMNTVFGFGGFIDIATPARLVYKKEDLGQTLYHWGAWKEASYIIMPFVGPYTTRELAGSLLDSGYDPTFRYVIETDTVGYAGFFVGSKFVDYTKIANLADEVKQQPDPYVFMRESYLQYRTNLIFDGKPPQAKLDDFNFD